MSKFSSSMALSAFIASSAPSFADTTAVMTIETNGTYANVTTTTVVNVKNLDTCIGIGKGAAAFTGRSVNITCIEDGSSYKNYVCGNDYNYDKRLVSERKTYCNEMKPD